ncbi:MAG: hypothetical protein FWB97_02515 [Oscillospiraceae bacterium]|nr:hypothetical protein [Oscillospiraceae bacterium]
MSVSNVNDPNYIPRYATWRGETVRNNGGLTNEVLTRRKLSLEVNARADPSGSMMQNHINQINMMRLANRTNNSISINTPTSAWNAMQGRRIDVIREMMAEEEEGSLKMSILQDMLDRAMLTKNEANAAQSDSAHISAEALASAQEQGDSISGAANQKLMAIRISNRIANGDNVPHQDHRFLLDFSPGMYQLALARSMSAENSDPEDYDALSGDDDSGSHPVEQQMPSARAGSTAQLQSPGGAGVDVYH